MSEESYHDKYYWPKEELDLKTKDELVNIVRNLAEQTNARGKKLNEVFGKVWPLIELMIQDGEITIEHL